MHLPPCAVTWDRRYSTIKKKRLLYLYLGYSIFGPTVSPMLKDGSLSLAYTSHLPDYTDDG